MRVAWVATSSLIAFLLAHDAPLLWTAAAVHARALRRPAFHAPTPWMETLRAEWRAIRDEHDAAALVSPSFVDVDATQERVDRNGTWRTLWLRMHGVESAHAHAHFPRTMRLLRDVPAHSIMFSLLPPHAALAWHRGPYSGVLRYHLGLRCDGAATLRVEGEENVYRWRDGEHVVFDDGHVHRAVNPSDRPRLVLWLDVPRDDLPPLLHLANRLVLAWTARSALVRRHMRRHDAMVTGAATPCGAPTSAAGAGAAPCTRGQ